MRRSNCLMPVQLDLPDELLWFTADKPVAGDTGRQIKELAVSFGAEALAAIVRRDSVDTVRRLATNAAHHARLVELP
jgi:hypothetical protein